MTDQTTRREFMVGAVAGTVGLVTVRPRHGSGERAAAEPAAPVKLGVASYSLRNFSRAYAIRAIGELGTPFVKQLRNSRVQVSNLDIHCLPTANDEQAGRNHDDGRSRLRLGHPRNDAPDSCHLSRSLSDFFEIRITEFQIGHEHRQQDQAILMTIPILHENGVADHRVQLLFSPIPKQVEQFPLLTNWFP